MTELLIRGGTVLDEHGSRRADVMITAGIVTAVEPTIDASGVRTLDASGCLVTPGFVDLHTHLREPGGEDAETIATGTRAATMGGFTAVVAMPNTDPTTDAVDIVEHVLAQARNQPCEVAVASAITKGRHGVQLVDIPALYAAGVRIFTDDGDPVSDSALMRLAFEQTAQLKGAVLAQHCEDAALVAGGAVNDGEIARQLGLSGRPGAAEEAMVARDIALARLTGGRLHILHLSDRHALDHVRRARAEGLRVTAEVAPHHLVLTERALHRHGTMAKMNPPLRTGVDMDAMREGLVDGSIDAIATDHAPHPALRKGTDLATAAPGIIGLETALSLATTHLVAPGLASMETIIAALTWKPARIAGLTDQGRPVAPGEPGHLAIVDPRASWTYDVKTSPSHSSNTPFHGAPMVGRVRHTVYAGVPTVIDSVLQG